MKTWFTAMALALSTSAPAAQDTPVDIPKNELPKKAACVVCTAEGGEHGEEKAAAGVRYKGKAFYFCNVKEVATFKKDPESFLPPVLPRPALPLALKTLDGKETTLAGMKGTVVLIDYWATWCKPCVAAMPDLQKLHEKYQSKGFSVVGVSIDEEGGKAVKPFIEKRKFTYPIRLDDAQGWKTWGVRVIPAMFLVDKNGQIVQQWTGKVDKKVLEKAIAALLE